MRRPTTARRPWFDKLIRPVTEEDVIRLFEIKMGRILKFNSHAAEEQIAAYHDRIADLEEKLANLTEVTIQWYESLKKKYGAAYPRHTVLRNFDNIEAATVAEVNEKLYINRKEGFIGTGLKKDEFLCNCSSIDDIIVFYKDGRYKVVKVQEKLFVGKDVLYVAVFKRNDVRTTYNAIYQNGRGGIYYMKRFQVTGITRDKEYNITQGLPGSKLLWFTANPNGEAETVKVTLKPKARLKSLFIEVDFSAIAIKGKAALGNIVTKNEVHRVSLKREGLSTLGGLEVWFDPDVLRLNYDGRGDYLGEFGPGDQLLVVMKNGQYYTTSFDLANHYDEGILRIERLRPGHVFTAVLFDAAQGYPYLKRFAFEPSAKKQSFIGESDKSELLCLSDEPGARFRITFGGKDDFRGTMDVVASEFVAPKSFKAKGKRLTNFEVTDIVEIEPVPVAESDEETEPNAAPDIDMDLDPDRDKSEDEVRDEITGQQRIF